MIVGLLIVSKQLRKARNYFSNSNNNNIACQIDFFVVSYVDYLWLDLDDKVSIKYADCEIRNYVTKHQLALMKASTNESLIPSLLHAQKTL